MSEIWLISLGKMSISTIQRSSKWWRPLIRILLGTGVVTNFRLARVDPTSASATFVFPCTIKRVISQWNYSLNLTMHLEWKHYIVQVNKWTFEYKYLGKQTSANEKNLRTVQGYESLPKRVIVLAIPLKNKNRTYVFVVWQQMLCYAMAVYGMYHGCREMWC